MVFTDIFIKRPVLASVVSLLIFLFGLKAIFSLPIQQFPEVKNTLITVTTSYPGASSDLIQGFITTPIQKAIASADGVDYITGESTESQSTISAYIKLNFDPDRAFTSIMSKVAQVKNQLPKESDDPIIDKKTGSPFALMYIGFNSDKMNPEQITDYITRVVQPQLNTIDGVADAQILGGFTFAMRIWLNPQRMAGFHLSPSDVRDALLTKNFQTAAGSTKGELVAFSINATTDLHTQEEFENIVVAKSPNTLVRLRDVATVKLGAESYDASVSFNGKKAIFVGIFPTPDANPLTTITHVRNILPELIKNFPPSLHGEVVYDSTDFIRASIKEVIKTIVEATIIVIGVIFLFLGDVRSVLIPIVTIPLSLVGVAALMMGLGYSINLLTLLAMVLAIGLVVDDAIVVVENVHRHIEEGLSPFDAAITGAREIAMPVISMTTTIVAVYVPIGLQSGLTGALFREFAFTLACSVLLSGVIALTLSPMMASKLLKPLNKESGLVERIDHYFDRLKTRYQGWLHDSLNERKPSLVFYFVAVLTLAFLFPTTQKELAPHEDQGAIFLQGTGPEFANINYTEIFSKQMDPIFKSLPEAQDYFLVNGSSGANSVFGGVILKSWGDRKRADSQVSQELQTRLNGIAGLQSNVFAFPPLPSPGRGMPIEFVINTTNDFPLLFEISQKILNAAQKSGKFMFVLNSLKYDKPRLNLDIDRAKASEMGISMQNIGDALAVSLGGNYINYFNMQSRSYEVIPQLLRQFRENPDQLLNLYVKNDQGDLIPLSTITKIRYTTEPNSLTQFQQLNAATIEAFPMPGQTVGDGLAYLENVSDQILPKGFTYNYSGESRQYVQEKGGFVYSFSFALIVIFLVLAAQFESWKDALIIVFGSVPLTVFAAMVPLNLGAATLNIYTQVGLITLVGLIAKHGILMVDFANQLQISDKLDIRAAIEKAAAIRLRPILMTTAAMVFGVLPLIIASGAGAASRRDIGIVIAFGMLVGTFFTLFMVPMLYTYLAKDHRQDL